jgi:protein SCO1/2
VPVKRGVTAAVLLVIAAGVVGAALGAGARDDGGEAAPVSGSQGPYRGSEPPGEMRLPRFALRDHTGELMRSDDVRGKVVVLTFLDSQCEDACPVIAREIALTVDALTGAERGAVEAIAISTDPAEDTPASVRRFLGRQRAIGRLRFLDGEERELRRLWSALNVLSSLESGKDDLHSAPVRVYDRRGVWVTTQHPGVDLTPRNLAHDIRVALRSD